MLLRTTTLLIILTISVVGASETSNDFNNIEEDANISMLLEQFASLENENSEEVASLGKYIISLLTVDSEMTSVVKVDIYNKLSRVYILSGNYAESFSMAKEGKLLAQKYNYNLGLGVAFKNIANVHSLLNNYELALSNYLEALRFTRKAGDSLEIARTLNSIAQVYSNIDKNNDSISVYQESIKILDNLGNKKFKAYALGGIAGAYRNFDNYTKALGFAMQSKKILEEIDDRAGLVICYNLIGDLQLQLNEYPSAKESFRLSLEIARENNLLSSITLPYLSLAKVALQETDYQLAKEFATKALSISSNRKELAYQARSLNILSQITEEQEDFSNSLNYFKQQKKIEQEIFNEKSDRSISLLRANFEFDQLDRKNKLLEQQNELIRIKIEKEKTQKLIILIFFLLVTLSIAFAYYRFVHNKKLQQEKLINEQLQSVNKLKDQILMNTSHEFRTPLTGIIGLAECLQEELMGPQSEESKKNLALIVNSGRRLNSLVDDILNFAQLKSGNFEMYISTVDVYRLVTDVVTTCSPLLLDKPITICNNLQENSFFALADEKRLVQVLYNLIGNAIKYSNQGEINITAEANDDEIEIKVSDEGIGIPEDKLEFIFEYFEQLDASSSRTQQGSGLGLAITKKLIELQKGAITVNSILEQGSVFSFTIPKAHETMTSERYEKTES